MRPSSERKVPQDTVPLPIASRIPSIARLFAAFFRLGATAFGGPAMIASMRTMAVEQRQWLEENTFRDGVVLCQTIPGATAMQMSAYIGLRVQGVTGAAASFLGFGLPAFLLMLALSALYTRTQTVPTVVALTGVAQGQPVPKVPSGWTFTFPEGNATDGQTVFTRMECYSCHAMKGLKEKPPTGAGGIGPDLSNYGTLPKEYLAESIIKVHAVVAALGYVMKEGKAGMGNYNHFLTIQELIDLVAFLKHGPRAEAK